MSERSRWEEAIVTDDEALEMASVLTDLVASPGWTAYMELLKGARVTAREAAFSGEGDRFDYFKGLVAGLTFASSLVTDTVAQAQRAVRKAQATDRKKRRPPTEGEGDTVI